MIRIKFFLRGLKPFVVEMDSLTDENLYEIVKHYIRGSDIKFHYFDDIKAGSIFSGVSTVGWFDVYD